VKRGNQCIGVTVKMDVKRGNSVHRGTCKKGSVDGYVKRVV
jgi:hypothetical protein